ncbi:MAG: TetR/AcrR family transcriptional regulator [Thermoanaerobaculia bacterium]
MDPDRTHSSRDRLLLAGKRLFAQHGYEQTSTAAISRQAGSSESQLVRYFGGKSGLLQAIFDDSWKALNPEIEKRVEAAANAREAVTAILLLIMDAFSRDSDLATVFLFEGRRIRGDEPQLSRGFLQFLELVGNLIRSGQQDGSFRSDFDAAVIEAGVVGAAEGMIRDRLLADRFGRAEPFDEAAVRRVFEAFVRGLAP